MARKSSYPHPYSYDPYDPFYSDPYYTTMAQSSAAAGPSHQATELYPPINRKRPAESLASRIAAPPSHSSSSAARERDASPPRKTARQNDGRPQDTRRPNVSERGEDAASTRERDRDRPVARPAPLPSVEPAIKAFVEAFRAQQDARKERLDVEVNNAKYLKYREREDISKENKAKAEKASEEINEAKRKDEVAWRAVERQTKEMLLAAQGLETERPRQRPEALYPATPPRRLPMAESDLEPGEIRVNTTTQPRSAANPTLPPGPPPARPPPPSSSPIASAVSVVSAPASAAIAADVTSAEKGKKKASDSVTRASILSKFEEIEESMMNIKSDTEERLDQMESNMEEVVRLEVESRIRKARTAFKNKEAGDGAKGKEIQGDTPSSTDRQAEIGGVRPAVASTTAQVAAPVAAPIAAQVLQVSSARSREESGMSHEQVTALVESVRQAMRQEFDTKLFEQHRAHQADTHQLRQQIAAQFKRDQETVTAGLNSHYVILSDHHDLLQRQEQLWQGTLGLFSNVPKPTVTP